MRRPVVVVLSLTIMTVTSAVLTLIWLARVWRGDNPTDRTVLLILAMMTVSLGVVSSAMIGKIKKRNTTP